MAATINGSLRTWFGSSLNGLDPFVRFIPSGLGIGEAGVYAAAIKDATVFGPSGQFTIQLEGVANKRPECWYTFEVHYNGPDGHPAKVDFPELRLYPPDNGTYDFGDIATGASNPFMVWVSLAPPEEGPGVRFWLQASSSAVTDPRNTGFLYEWSGGAWVVISDLNGPQGKQGERGVRGLPGVNALANDAAVGAYLDAAYETETGRAALGLIPDVPRPGGFAALRAWQGARGVKPLNIVFLGSSTVQGHLADPTFRWVNILAARHTERPVRTLTEAAAAEQLAAPINFINGGIGGADSTDYVNSAILDRIVKLDPRLVVIMVGSNDYKRGINPETYRKKIMADIATINDRTNNPTGFLLIQSYQRMDSFTPAYPWLAYRAALKQIEFELQNVSFLDLHSSYRAVGVPGGDPFKLIQTVDYVHMTDAGHQMMAELVDEVLPMPETFTAVQTRHSSDAFSGADTGNFVGRTLDNGFGGGAASTWIGDAGAMAIVGNRATAGTPSGPWFTGAVAPVTAGNYEVSFYLTAAVVGQPLYLDVRRAVTSTIGSAYRLAVTEAGTVELMKRDTALNLVTLGKGGAFRVGDRLAIRARGNIISILVNNKIVASVFDDEITGDGRWGFAGSTSTTSYRIARPAVEIIT
jgi:lysophospholipase L1-like esterase